VAGICDLILSQKEDDNMRQVTLELDGQKTRINVFVRKFIENVVRGIVASLDDVPENPRSIVIRIENETKNG
jgi:hypothetical protein